MVAPATAAEVIHRGISLDCTADDFTLPSGHLAGGPGGVNEFGDDTVPNHRAGGFD